MPGHHGPLALQKGQRRIVGNVRAVDRVVDPERMDQARTELAGWMDSVSLGRDSFTGRRTQRVGGLIARSTPVRDLVESPIVLGSVAATLAHASNFQLHLTQTIAIGPGETSQQIHRDQWAFDFFPFPSGSGMIC